MSDELSYYRERADAELQRAALSTNPEAAKAHYELAGRYLDLVHGGGTRIESRQAAGTARA